VYTVFTLEIENAEMIHQQLRKAGNSYVITIPKEEVERNGWSIGDRFAVQLTLLEERPVLSDEIRAALEASWERNEEAYRYLAR
jgi:antitoxin component of MazEF toxin-antitoxin module